MTANSSVSVTAGALLGLLNERPMTGWELVEEAESRVGAFWKIQRSQAYRELGQLEETGLVESLPIEERGRRRYRITADGQDAYREWAHRVPGGESIRVPFLLSVAFSHDIAHARFAELLADQRRRHAERVEEYETLWEQLTADGTVRSGERLATLALGIGYEQATLAWLDDLPRYLGMEDDTDAT